MVRHEIVCGMIYLVIKEVFGEFMRKNYKKGICLILLFSFMFFTGRWVAQMRDENTVRTSAAAGAADNWGLGFGADGTQPSGNVTADELKQYDAYYVGDNSEKVIYLTFDCGYGNGQQGLEESGGISGSFFVEK